MATQVFRDRSFPRIAFYVWNRPYSLFAWQPLSSLTSAWPVDIFSDASTNSLLISRLTVATTYGKITTAI
jgi:hypothetical protein